MDTRAEDPQEDSPRAEVNRSWLGVARAATGEMERTSRKSGCRIRPRRARHGVEWGWRTLEAPV